MTRIRNILLLLWLGCSFLPASSQETATASEDLVDELIDFDTADEERATDTTDNSQETVTTASDADVLVDEALVDPALKEDSATSSGSEEDNSGETQFESEEDTELSESNETDDGEPQLDIRSNLETMSDEELRQICVDRGFDIVKEGGAELTHEDYIEAATQCLNIQDEISSILKDNPELADELETEIERMKTKKEQLESEREAMMAEKETLEKQLRESGVDPTKIVPPSDAANLRPTKNDLTTHEGALRESFEQLFAHVGRDMRLVGKVARILLRPVGNGISLVWRYSEPTVSSLVKKAIVIVDVPPVQSLQTILNQQAIVLSKLYRTAAVPAFMQGIVLLETVYRRLDGIGKLHTAFVLVGAILGPLKNSLLDGWKSVQPDLSNAKRRCFRWFQRQRAEATSKKEPQIKN